MAWLEPLFIVNSGGTVVAGAFTGLGRADDDLLQW